MAVTISTSQDWDSAARATGEAVTIDSAAVLTVNTDTRYHKNAPTGTYGEGSFGSFTMTDQTGGEVLFDGRDVRLIPYTSGTGNAPAYDTDIVGDTSGATGKLLGVYTDITSAPIQSGSAINATGFIKIKSASAAYNASETLTGVSATTNGVDTTGWIEIAFRESATITIGIAQKWTVRGDWFYLDDTTGVASQVLQLPTCGGGVNTYYPCVWIETSVGSDEYEAYPGQKYTANSTSGWYGTAKGTDIRNKFVEMKSNGQMGINTLSKGYLPAAGLKVRIPNVIFVNTRAAIDEINVTPNATIGTRPEFNVQAAGNLDVDGCLSQMYHNFKNGYSLILKNTGILERVYLENIATPMEIDNLIQGDYSNVGRIAFTMTACFAGGTFNQIKFGRVGTRTWGGTCNTISYSKGFTFTDCTFDGRIARTANTTYVLIVSNSSDLRFIRPVFIGTGAQWLTCANMYIEDFVYADSYHTVSTGTNASFAATMFQTGSSNIEIKGGGWYPGVANVHNDSALVYISDVDNFTWTQCGTRDTPIVAGSTNRMYYGIRIGNYNTNIKIKRVYIDNLASTFLTTSALKANYEMVLENCGGSYADVYTVNDANSCITKGLQCPAADTSFVAIYDTIFYNIFTSTTAGRVGLTFNEDSELYSDYVDKTGLTGGSGFDSTGKCYLYNLNDVIEYEFPYFIKGYTAFASSNVVKGGSGTANLGVKYQINTGSGWNGSWKDATSANLSAESIDEADGFKLKIQITCTSAATNYLNSLYFSMVSTDAAQDEQYPLNVVDVTVTVLDIDLNPIEDAVVAIYESVGDAVIMNELTLATGIATETYGYEDDTVIYYRVRKSSSGSTRYIPLKGVGTIVDTGFSTTVTLTEDNIVG